MLNAQEVATLKLLANQVSRGDRQRVEYKLNQEGGIHASMSGAQAVEIVRAYSGCDDYGTLTDLGRGNALNILSRPPAEGY